MPDLLLDGLPVIDLLEITASTSVVAALTRRDQSSVSRIYRRASDRLGLAFAKDQAGAYRAGANLELLRDLRRSSQRLRLQTPETLRWLCCSWPGPEPPPLEPPPLPWQPGDGQRAAALLREHLIDLAVVAHPPPPEAGPEAPLIALHLGPANGPRLLLRADLQTEPAVQRLLAAITAAHRHALQPPGCVEWDHACPLPPP